MYPCKAYFLMQGQAFYIGKHVHILYPIVSGQDIASSDSDEGKVKQLYF